MGLFCIFDLGLVLYCLHDLGAVDLLYEVRSFTKAFIYPFIHGIAVKKNSLPPIL